MLRDLILRKDVKALISTSDLLSTLLPKHNSETEDELKITHTVGDIVHKAVFELTKYKHPPNPGKYGGMAFGKLFAEDIEQAKSVAEIVEKMVELVNKKLTGMGHLSFPSLRGVKVDSTIVLSMPDAIITTPDGKKYVYELKTMAKRGVIMEKAVYQALIQRVAHPEYSGVILHTIYYNTTTGSIKDETFVIKNMSPQLVMKVINLVKRYRGRTFEIRTISRTEEVTIVDAHALLDSLQRRTPRAEQANT
ncbi:hypothetical protein [Pyrococcus kukulkanii]|uniref:PD-(D/E)XK endonuclease-like domain-containing protein n=1 Tax=Pyrococcus kukulkanii TaxID=1609559 RepID=A0ABV4T5Y4_9EURY